MDESTSSTGTRAPDTRPGVVLARQNLPLIVEKGRPNPLLTESALWGNTLGNAIRVWRAGVGIDRHGNLIDAAASDQTASTLAAILTHAGAVRAIELDINGEWPSLITYGRNGIKRPDRSCPTHNSPPAATTAPATVTSSPFTSRQKPPRVPFH